MNLVTSEYLPDIKKGNLKEALVCSICIYQNKGMHVTTALADGEFEPLKGNFGAADLNAASAANYVPEIEHTLRLVKECFSTLPYKLLLGHIIVEGINLVVKCFNSFPTKTCASHSQNSLSAWGIFTLDYISR